MNFVARFVEQRLPVFVTTSLPNGTVGTAYNQLISMSSAYPITWSVSQGSLPGGLSLSQDGRVIGTPTTAGIFTFTLRAQTIRGYVAREFTITIAGATVAQFTINVTAGQGGSIYWWHTGLDYDHTGPANITVRQGDYVELFARPNIGFDFDGWFEGNTRVSSAEFWRFTATRSMTVQARFIQEQQAVVPPPPTPPQIIFNDTNSSAWAREERICSISNGNS